MLVRAMSFQLSILPEPRATQETIHDCLPDIMHRPFMVPFLLQTLEVIPAKPTPEFSSGHLRMRAPNMLVKHRFEMEHFVTILTLNRVRIVVILHVLGDHFLRIELALTQVALEVRGTVDFLVFREVAGITKGFVAEGAFV